MNFERDGVLGDASKACEPDGTWRWTVPVSDGCNVAHTCKKPRADKLVSTGLLREFFLQVYVDGIFWEGKAVVCFAVFA